MHIKRSEWENLSPEDLELMKKRIFDHYRDKGFPFYKETIRKQKHNIEQMNKYFETHNLIQGDIIKQTLH